MTGVAADADELVQETFIKALESTPPRELLPWLVTVASNKSRDLLRKRKNASYVGSWLPAPVEETEADEVTPDARYGQAESMSYAFLIALEALSPTQRACVILRDVMGYSVLETAEALTISEANVKTSHHRAREALEQYEAGKAKRQVSLVDAQQAMMRFMTLVGSGEIDRVASLLAEEVRAVNDGAGEFLAALNPVISREHVVRFLRGVNHGVEIVSARALVCGGMPALLAVTNPPKARAPRRSLNLFDVNAAGEIVTIYAVVATRKLTAFTF